MTGTVHGGKAQGGMLDDDIAYAKLKEWGNALYRDRKIESESARAEGIGDGPRFRGRSCLLYLLAAHTNLLVRTTGSLPAGAIEVYSLSLLLHLDVRVLSNRSAALLDAGLPLEAAEDANMAIRVSTEICTEYPPT